MRTHILLLILIVAACSREQSNAAVATVAKTYNESHRDNVIKNHQARVRNSPVCAEFKARFKAAGERYENAANAAFHIDMMKVAEAAKAAGCEVPA